MTKDRLTAEEFQALLSASGLPKNKAATKLGVTYQQLNNYEKRGCGGPVARVVQLIWGQDSEPGRKVRKAPKGAKLAAGAEKRRAEQMLYSDHGHALIIEAFLFYRDYGPDPSDRNDMVWILEQLWPDDLKFLDAVKEFF